MLPSIIDAVQVGGWCYRGIIPWNKGDQARPRKGWFRSQCEYIVTATSGALTEPPEDQTNYASGFITVNTVQTQSRFHVTEKPVELIGWLISIRHEWQTIFDPFMGSGTTGVAALRAGKKFIGIEYTPEYFDIACKRIEAANQEHPLLIEHESQL